MAVSSSRYPKDPQQGPCRRPRYSPHQDAPKKILRKNLVSDYGGLLDIQKAYIQCGMFLAKLDHIILDTKFITIVYLLKKMATTSPSSA